MTLPLAGRPEPKPADAARPRDAERLPDEIQRWTRVVIGGLPIAVVDRATSARAFVDAAVARRGRHLHPLYTTSANGEVVTACAQNPAIRQLFLDADVIHADGMPLVFASRIRCSEPLPERVATTDLIQDVAAIAAREGATFYLLGASPAVSREAARRLRAAHPGLQIVGRRDGFYAPDEEDAVITDIAAKRPDFLFVCMGVPREQAFVARAVPRLTGVGLIKTGGGVLDFVAGARRRAPAWMQAGGLEWLWRASLEPRRLGWRYARSNPYAIYLLMTRSW